MQLDVKLPEGVLLTYATPILYRRVPEAEALNAGLERILLQKEAAHPEFRTGRLNRSNYGGWRSEPEVLTWPEPEIATFRRHVREGARTLLKACRGARGDNVTVSFEIVAWANINRRGDYHIVHGHADNHWSGSYYVAMGDADPKNPLSGVLEFQDPRPATQAMSVPGTDFGFKQPIKPEAGMLLMFPSWHQHFVHPFTGDGKRITIAFNIRIRGFKEAAPAA